MDLWDGRLMLILDLMSSNKDKVLCIKGTEPNLKSNDLLIF